ncbi:MAG: hypothetical protein GY703_24495 [Gammaproteobacteria bacterium]|nr:hypothetical protein [Gammaproteobacteria bacterium]
MPSFSGPLPRPCRRLRPIPHALPTGFHRIRHYGLIANTGRRNNLARTRALLMETTIVNANTMNSVDEGNSDADDQEAAHQATYIGPECGAPKSWPWRISLYPESRVIPRLGVLPVLHPRRSQRVTFRNQAFRFLPFHPTAALPCESRQFFPRILMQARM